jgi:Domain of unknown function (DUF4390)
MMSKRGQMTEEGGRKAGGYWRRRLSCFLFFVFCLLPAAFAENISVNRVEAYFPGNSYQLSADFNIKLDSVVGQALMHGVPLYFVSEFTLTHPRWYWLDEVVAQSSQTIRLSYNSLTRQYRITRGSLFQNFSSLDEALNVLSHQAAQPIPASLLKSGEDYDAAARMWLDTSLLPKPLQVNALTGSDWNLDTGWYRWIVHPEPGARGE